MDNTYVLMARIKKSVVLLMFAGFVYLAATIFFSTVSRGTENGELRSLPQSYDKTGVFLSQRKMLLSKPNAKKKVVLFCYMRGGSTFFSELFRQNKEVMYWYEPYDAFYSAYFGEKTWHFPQDIFWYQHSAGNSSLRIQTEEELQEMARFNHNMLSCNFSGLPVELMYHKGFGKSNLALFQSCLRNHSNTDPSNCRSNIQRCTGNSKVVLEHNCPKNIKLARELVQANETSETTNSSIIDPAFVKHSSCNVQFLPRIQSCTHILEKQCQASKMTTYKGLRINMKSIEYMLQLDPDLFIIYYVRDPRGTVLSRVKIRHTYRDTKNSAVLESKYHCAKMRADLEIYDRLQVEYPGSILLVKYEDVASNPYDEVTRIYDFYGMCVHHSVFTWMKQNEEATSSGGVFSTSRANATASIDKWRHSVKPEVAEQMTLHCKDVLLKLNYTL